MVTLFIRKRRGSKVVKSRRYVFTSVENLNKWKEKAEHMFEGQPDIEIFMAFLDPQAPNKEVTIPKGRMWCPYCAKPQKFIAQNDLLRCQYCGISDRDFYVRTYNGTWHKFTANKRRANKNDYY